MFFESFTARRRMLLRVVVIAVPMLALLYHLRDYGPQIQSHLSLPVSHEDFSDTRVVIYEPWGHDEVVGSITASLVDIGVKPILNFNFRWKFDNVVRSLIGDDVIIENPHEKDDNGMTPIQRRLLENSVDVLIITTCYNSLAPLYKDILASSVRVICVQHTGDQHSMDTQIKDKAHELVRQGRLALIGLSDHVVDGIDRIKRQYALKRRASEWERLPTGAFTPVFDYPRNTAQPQRAVFPSRVVIQGKLDPGRRDYYRIFRDLVASLEEDASVWGYKTLEKGKPAVAEDDSAFELWLLGAAERKPLTIPIELSNIIHVFESLNYTDYYQMLSEADMLLPAFQHAGYYENTASSSITAALITRLPILLNPIHINAYRYLRDPAIIMRAIPVPDVTAIRDLRLQGSRSRPSAQRWDDMFSAIRAENAALWRRLILEGRRLGNSPRVDYSYDDKGNNEY